MKKEKKICNLFVLGVQFLSSCSLFVSGVPVPLKITGDVHDRDGNAISKAIVQVIDERSRMTEWGTSSYTTTAGESITDDKGHFKVNAKCIGNYDVKVTKTEDSEDGDYHVEYYGYNMNMSPQEKRNIDFPVGKKEYFYDCAIGREKVAISPMSVKQGDELTVRTLNGWRIRYVEILIAAFWTDEKDGSLHKNYRWDFQGDYGDAGYPSEFTFPIKYKISNYSNYSSYNRKQLKSYIRIACFDPQDGSFGDPAMGGELIFYCLPIELIGSGVEPLVPLEEFYGQ